MMISNFYAICLLLTPTLAAESVIAAELVVVQVAASDPSQPHNGSLQEILCSPDSELSSGTILQLDPGVHFIVDGSTCVVMDVSDITLTSLGGASIECESNGLLGSNFMFLNVTNLTMSNIRVNNCGHVVPQNLPTYVNNTFIYIDQEQKAVFIFSLVTNLHLVNFVVTRSFGYSIIGVNLRGDAELRGITLSDTDNYRHPLCHRNETGLACSGSGAVFIYSDPLSEEEFLPDPTTTISLQDSNITNNENNVPINHIIPLFYSFRAGFELTRLLLTGTTGVTFYFGQQKYAVDVSITSTIFSNNYGYIGALGFVLTNLLRNIHIEVEGCALEHNQGFGIAARGGGMLIVIANYIPDLYSLFKSPLGQHDLITVRNTTFINNFADIGGAVYFFFTPQNVSDYSITFDNVIFSGNCARIGTVIQVETRPATFITNNYNILLLDITASNNVLLNSIENSAAFVFTNVFNVTVSGRDHTQGSMITSNVPGGFLVVGSNLFLQGKVVFHNNTAQRGGAISLHGSLFFIFEGSRIIFSYNSAIQVGGAIYAVSPISETVATCIFQVIGPSRISNVSNFDQLNMSVQFINNTAIDGGNSLYVTPLYNCASLPESSLVDLSIIDNTSGFYSQLFNFADSIRNSLTEITSFPECICLCDNVSQVTPQCWTTSDPIVVYPGQQFTLSVFPVDFNYNPVSSILFVDLRSKEHQLGRGQATMQLKGGECTDVDLNLSGPAGSNITLFLHTQNGATLLMVDVVIQECPPGFLLMERDESIVCICDPYIESLGRTCNFTTFTINRQRSEWLEYSEHGNFTDLHYVYSCPIGFCNRTIRSMDLTITDQLCVQGRTGILCGSCKGNQSVVFGTPECMECSNYWLFTVLLYAAAGIFLVTVLFISNFTVTQGSLISVIFYSNLVGVNFDIVSNFNNRKYVSFWISLLNLELGFPLCFYNGMTEIGKASLQCIFPAYLLLIALAIIFLSQRSRVIAKLTSSHGIQVLATLIYLSYSKMLRYVISIFSYATLRGKYASAKIWLFDGNIEYFTSLHAVIVIVPAAITLILIAVYMLMMVFIKQIEQYTSKLKPLLDAYGGPFKDQYRFWFGVRLQVLSVMCLVYAYTGTDDPIMAVIIQQILLILFMALQAYVQPFRNQFLNVLDLLLMLNLYFLLLSVVKLYNSNEEVHFIVISLLLCLAFFLFTLLLVYHTYKFPRIHDKLQQVKCSKIMPAFKQRWSRHCKEGVEGVGGAGMGRNSSGISSTVISLQSAEDMDGLPSLNTHFTQFREPMMDEEMAA